MAARPGVRDCQAGLGRRRGKKRQEQQQSWVLPSAILNPRRAVDVPGLVTMRQQQTAVQAIRCFYVR